MYKVFINEKKLTISKSVTNAERNIIFNGITSLEIALDLIENTSCTDINIYGDDSEEIWRNFSSLFKIIDAAGGVVFNKENKILFIHRLGKWDLPKGKLEPQEFLKNAAVREVEEETGLKDLILEDFINTTFHIYKEKREGKEQKMLKSTYWFKMNYTGHETPKPQIEEGITEVDWKTNEEIQEKVFPNTFQNIKLILKEVL
jgi:8-oxo-dGTP pyrophosphatase MutT (NUDIX family)